MQTLSRQFENIGERDEVSRNLLRSSQNQKLEDGQSPQSHSDVCRQHLDNDFKGAGLLNGAVLF